MVYEEKTWASKEIINREELQHIEDGISAAHTRIDEIQQYIDSIPDSSGYMLKSTYDPDIDAKVESSEISDALKNGESIKTYSDISSEIDSDILTHSANVAAHHTRYTDVEAQAAINADTDHGTTAPHNYRTDAEIRTVTSNMLVAGTGITLTPGTNTLTAALSDNAFTTAYKTKLDGIEVGATADQTGDEIITAINSSTLKIDSDNITFPADSFTAAYKTKLDGIETGATADQTGSEIVAAINASSAVINSANINRGNLSTIIERGFIGEVVVGDTIRIYNPGAGVIQSVTLISETKPISTSLMVDIRKNGTLSTNSIFSSDNPMILSTSATATNGVYKVNGILDATQVNLVDGDILRVYVLQTGSAVDVSVCIKVLY